MPQPPPNGTHIGLFHLRDDEIKTIKITVKNSLCLDSKTFGSYNTSSGEGALSRNTGGGNSIPAGSYNTANGAGALAFNTTGRYNTAIGFQALISNTTGNRNIAIGSDAGPLLDIGDNNIIIGSHPAGPGFLNTVIIGDGVNQSRAFIYGIFGQRTGSSNVGNVLIDQNGQLGTIPSSRRYKEEVYCNGKPALPPHLS
jgi:hypothetical protein